MSGTSRKRVRSLNPNVSGGGNQPEDPAPEIDVFLDDAGNIDLSHNADTLFWENFVAGSYGTVDIAGDETYRATFFSSQGTVDVDQTDEARWTDFSHGETGAVDIASTTLFWRPFVAGSYGTVDIQGGDDVLRWRPFILASHGDVDIDQDQQFTSGSITATNVGTVNVGDDSTLRWRPFTQPQGTANVADRALRFNSVYCGQLTSSGPWTNVNNQLGRPDSTFASTTTGSATQAGASIRTQLGTSNITTSGSVNRVIPNTIQFYADYVTNLALGVGENYDLTFNGTIIFQNQTAVHSYSGPLGNRRCLTDTNAVRNNINAISTTNLFNNFNNIFVQWQHDKAAVAASNTGTIQPDGYEWTFLTYTGAAPTTTFSHNFNASNWTHSNFTNSSNRIQNSSAVAAANGSRNSVNVASGQDFDVIWRWSVARPVTGTTTHEFRFWTENLANDISGNPGLTFTVGASSANDDLDVVGLGTGDLNPGAPASNWIVDQDAQTGGNWMWLTARRNADDSTDHNVKLRLLRYRGDGQWDRLIEFQRYTLAIAGAGDDFGYFSFRLPSTGTAASWMDDLMFFLW